jgi:hypothetical protein
MANPMTSPSVFDLLLILARPAAGKSEVIHYLKNLSPQVRQSAFHLGRLDELDDFPMLWTWFEEDALLEKMGHPRLHTDSSAYFLHSWLWDLLIERIGLDYQKLLRDRRPSPEGNSTLVEFSRGTEHGGYASAFKHLPALMLEWMAILYIDVPWEESLRKNRARFNPDRPDSILEHSLPDAKLERLYKETDWPLLAPQPQGYLTLQGFSVPYVTFPNDDDLTTLGGEALGNRLEEKLNILWKLKNEK